MKAFLKNNQDKIRGVLAVAIAVAVAAVTLHNFGIRYQTNDDATLSNIAAGAYGDSVHMVYVNVLFSLLLRPLYALWDVNWYVVIQLALVVVSIAVIAYLAMKKLGIFGGGCAVLAILSAFAHHIFYSFQYTECSFIILTAGLLLVAENLGRFNKGTVFGIVLSLFGAMIRWSGFYAVGAMSAAILLYRFFRLDKRGKKMAVITMAVLFGVTFGAKLVDMGAYAVHDGWKEYTAYNAARTRYSDFKSLQLGQENPFEQYGITDVDYVMLSNWDFYDEERFDTPLIEQLAEGKQDISFEQLCKATGEKLKAMTQGDSSGYLLLAVCILSLAAIRPRWAVTSLAGVFATFGLLVMYLLYEIRFPSWVETGLIWTLAVFAVFCIGEIKPNRVIFALCSVVLLVYSLGASVPFYRELQLQSPAYKEWTGLEQGYFEQMSADKDNIYLLSTAAINVAAGFDVSAPRTDGFYSNIVAYGGWLSRAPHRDKALESYGLERPLVDAVDNPNVFLDYHNIDHVERYVEQELGIDVQVVKTGSNDFAPYQLVTTVGK
ncbi:MAG: hypothetical protein IKV52_01295 [Oscillospiraceae bacterium]|nr:hypothetical protein [Oscillospiraceae bacterium]